MCCVVWAQKLHLVIKCEGGFYGSGFCDVTAHSWSTSCYWHLQWVAWLMVRWGRYYEWHKLWTKHNLLVVDHLQGHHDQPPPFSLCQPPFDRVPINFGGLGATITDKGLGGIIWLRNLWLITNTQKYKKTNTQTYKYASTGTSTSVGLRDQVPASNY